MIPSKLQEPTFKMTFTLLNRCKSKTYFRGDTYYYYMYLPFYFYTDITFLREFYNIKPIIKQR